MSTIIESPAVLRALSDGTRLVDPNDVHSTRPMIREGGQWKVGGMTVGDWAVEQMLPLRTYDGVHVGSQFGSGSSRYIYLGEQEVPSSGTRHLYAALPMDPNSDVGISMLNSIEDLTRVGLSREDHPDTSRILGRLVNQLNRQIAQRPSEVVLNRMQSDMRAAAYVNDPRRRRDLMGRAFRRAGWEPLADAVAYRCKVRVNFRDPDSALVSGSVDVWRVAEVAPTERCGCDQARNDFSHDEALAHLREVVPSLGEGATVRSIDATYECETVEAAEQVEQVEQPF